MNEKDDGKVGSLQAVQENSEKFFEVLEDKLKASYRYPKTPLPTDNRISTILEKKPALSAYIKTCIDDTHPFAHEKFKPLLTAFLTHKRAHGSKLEKAFYANLTEDALCTRLLHKRPLVFMKVEDLYVLRSEHGCSYNNNGNEVFDRIGTDQQADEAITLENYLSYDEMELSALLCVSSPTVFINQGSRPNQGLPAEEGQYEETGIYVGAVGPRFERFGKMECQRILITEDQNTLVNGYGLPKTSATLNLMQHFAALYGVAYFPTYTEVKEEYKENEETCRKKYVVIKNNYNSDLIFFNKAAYKARLRLIIEPFLIHAQQKGEAAKKDVYLYLVGLGMGVWTYLYKASNYLTEIPESELATLFVEVFHDVFKANSTSFTRIKTLSFSWFPAHFTKPEGNSWGSRTVHYGLPNPNSSRNPATPLTGDDADKLLVALYAWDSNAYPGNEFWIGKLAESGDPAAICCSIVGETQNVEINPHQLCAQQMQYYAASNASENNHTPRAITVSETVSGKISSDSDTQPEQISVSAQAQKYINDIVAVAKEFEADEEKPELTLGQKQRIRAALRNFSLPGEKKALQAALEKENVIFDFYHSLETSKSLRLCFNEIVTGLEKKKETQLTDTSKDDVSDVTTVICSDAEQDQYPYFPVTEEGDVICLVPFMSCNESNISSENTCKTGEYMKAALLGSGGKGPKIIETLNDYLRDLESDFYSLKAFPHDQDKKPDDQNKKPDIDKFCLSLSSTSEDPLLKGKAKRYLQLKRYQKIVNQIVADNTLKNDLNGDLFSTQFPKPIRSVLKASNAVSFLIVPQSKGPDNFLRLTPATLFSFERERNPNYETGFAVALKNSLSKFSKKLTAEKLSNTFTKKQLLHAIKCRYVNAIGSSLKPEDEKLVVNDVSEFRKLRAAIGEEVKLLKTSTDDIQNIIASENYVDENQTIKGDEDIFAFVRTDLAWCGENESPPIKECIEVILDDTLQGTLTTEIGRSPFDEPTVETVEQYHELIQIFLASACFCHVESLQNYGDPETRINFGQRIEQDKSLQAGLIQAIEGAISNSLSLEDTIVQWLEKNILSTPHVTCAFDEKTNAKIKKLFRETWLAFYNPEAPAPHLDEFLMAMENNPKNSPQVVVYCNAMMLPLDVFCAHDTEKPWLNEEFKDIKNSGQALPNASQLKLENNITVRSFKKPQAVEITVMSHLRWLMDNEPKAAAQFLQSKTREGKTIFTLLSLDQAELLKKHDNWKQVSTVVVDSLSIRSKAQLAQFEKKFKLSGNAIRITRDMQQSLYAYFSQLRTGKQGTSRWEIMAMNSASTALPHIINDIFVDFKLNWTRNPIVTKTMNATYRVELENQEQVASVRKVCEDYKTKLYISMNMAACFYRKLSQDDKAAEVNLEKASSRFSNHDKPELTSRCKFPSAMRALFPDLTIFMRNGKEIDRGNAPNDKTEESDDVITLEFNPVDVKQGYQITASNPDNLCRIRDYYESAITHHLSAYEAGKLLQVFVGMDKGRVGGPVPLTLETLETALLSLMKKPYNWIIAVAGGYQISCEADAWAELIRHKQEVKEVYPSLVDLGRAAIASEIVEEFFKAIDAVKIEDAKRLLSENPALLNQKNPKDGSTPLIYAITVAASKDNDQETGLLSDFCLCLIANPGIELTHADSSDDTALHGSVRYGNEAAPDSNRREQFDKVSIAILEGARQAGIKNIWEAGGYQQVRYYDQDHRVMNLSKKHAFWALLAQTCFYDFQPAIHYLLLAHDRPHKYILQSILNAVHPKTEKLPLQSAIEMAAGDAVIQFIDCGADSTLPTKEGDQSLAELAITLWVEETDEAKKQKFEYCFNALFYKLDSTQCGALFKSCVEKGKLGCIKTLLEHHKTALYNKQFLSDTLIKSVIEFCEQAEESTKKETFDQIQHEVFKSTAEKERYFLLMFCIKRGNLTGVQQLLEMGGVYFDDIDQALSMIRWAILAYEGKNKKEKIETFEEIELALFRAVANRGLGKQLLTYCETHGYATSIKNLLTSGALSPKEQEEAEKEKIEKEQLEKEKVEKEKLEKEEAEKEEPELEQDLEQLEKKLEELILTYYETYGYPTSTENLLTSGALSSKKQEKAEKEKAEKEKAEKENLEKEKAEKENLEKEKAEKENLEKEKAEKEKVEKEKAEKEKVEKEKVEKEKVEKEKLEKEKVEKETAEKEKVEKEKAEKEKVEKEKAEKEKVEKEKAEKEKVEKEKAEKEKVEKEKLEKEKVEKEKLEKEKAEKEKVEKEKLEKEKVEKETAEKEKAEKEKAEKEKLEKEKAEKEKVEKEKAEKEKVEKEKVEKETAEKEKAEKELEPEPEQDLEQLEKLDLTIEEPEQTKSQGCKDRINALKIPEGLAVSEETKKDLEEKLCALRAALCAEMDAEGSSHSEVEEAVALIQALIQKAICPFTKNGEINRDTLKKVIEGYDEALLSLSLNQQVGVLISAFLGAVLGMAVGCLTGYTGEVSLCALAGITGAVAGLSTFGIFKNSGAKLEASNFLSTAIAIAIEPPSTQ